MTIVMQLRIDADQETKERRVIIRLGENGKFSQMTLFTSFQESKLRGLSYSGLGKLAK